MIRESTVPDNWIYVKSADNPADIVSRGCTIDELTNDPRWFNGPKWLPNWVKVAPPAMTQNDEEIIANETLKNHIVSANVIIEEGVFGELMNRVSTFGRVVRVVGWIVRYLNKRFQRNTVTERYLTIPELRNAELLIVRHLQRIQFFEEIARLQSGKLVRTTSVLKCLSPFLDKEGVLRVGGRIEHAELPFGRRHPIILAHHPILDSLIEYNHIEMLHGGPI